MPHVVTSACIDHKYQDCVAVCPVDAFRETEKYLIIDPEECIDCGACAPECPVDAIFSDTDILDEDEAWIDRNAHESIDAERAEGDSPILADDEFSHEIPKIVSIPRTNVLEGRITGMTDWHGKN